MPYLFAGLKIAITLAVIGVIVAEFISSSEGLGFLILKSAALLRTDLILAAITVLCVIGLGLLRRGACGRARRAPLAGRMTDIGLPLSRPAAWDLAGLGRQPCARWRRPRSRRPAVRRLGARHAQRHGDPAPAARARQGLGHAGALARRAAGAGAAHLLGRRRRHRAGRRAGHRAGCRRLLLAHADADGLSHHRLLPAHPQGGAGAGVPAVVRHGLRGQRDLLGVHRLLPRRGGDHRRPAGRPARLRTAVPQPDDAAADKCS